LDEESAEMIRQTIRELNERGGDMAVVLVTHSREMMRVADWIVVLGEGGVAVEQGTYLDLWAKRGEFARLLTGGEFG
jgi:ATP-binding cassette subfamily B (MDR/TAP) protein 1